MSWQAQLLHVRAGSILARADQNPAVAFLYPLLHIQHRGDVLECRFVGPDLEWSEVAELAEARGLHPVRGRPLGGASEALHVWEGDGTVLGVTEYLDVAACVGVVLVYSEEATIGELVGTLREQVLRLTQRSDPLDELTARVHASELDFESAMSKLDVDEVIGSWIEWRHSGVCHLYEAWTEPAALKPWRIEFDEMEEALPTLRERSALLRTTREEEAAARAADRLRRREEAISALAEHPNFSGARNNTVRKMILEDLGLNLSGLNVSDIVAIARERAPGSN